MQQRAAVGGLRRLGLDEEAANAVAQRVRDQRQSIEWSPIHDRTELQRRLRLPGPTEEIYPRLRPREGGKGLERGLPVEPYPKPTEVAARDRELLNLFEELRATRTPQTPSPIPGLRQGGGRMIRRGNLEAMPELPRNPQPTDLENALYSEGTNRWRDELTRRAVQGESEQMRALNPGPQVPPGPGRAMRQRTVDRYLGTTPAEDYPIHVPAQRAGESLQKYQRRHADWLREHNLPTPSEMHQYPEAGALPRAEVLRSETLRGIQESSDPQRLAQAMAEAQSAGVRHFSRWGPHRVVPVAGRRGLLQAGMAAAGDVMDTPLATEAMRGVGRFLDTMQPQALPESMIQAIQRGPRAINVTHHALLQTDPTYRQRFQRYQESEGAVSQPSGATPPGPIDVAPSGQQGGDLWGSDVQVQDMRPEDLWGSDEGVQEVNLDELQ